MIKILKNILNFFKNTKLPESLDAEIIKKMETTYVEKDRKVLSFQVNINPGRAIRRLDEKALAVDLAKRFKKLQDLEQEIPVDVHLGRGFDTVSVSGNVNKDTEVIF